MALSAQAALDMARQSRQSGQPVQVPRVPQQRQIINQPQSNSFTAKATRAGLAGLGTVGKILSIPSELTEKVLTGGSTYEKRFGASPLVGGIARFVLDPLNFVSFGAGGVAKIAAKGLVKGGTIALTKAAGKELGELALKVGREEAENIIRNKIAKGATNLIDKGGVKVGLPFTEGKTVAQFPNLATKISPVASKIVSKIPQPIKTAAVKTKQFFEYPLNRAAPKINDIVDVASANKQKYFELGDKLVASYQKATPTVRAVADDILRGTIKEAPAEFAAHPLITTALESRGAIDQLGQEAVQLGKLSPETYQAGQGTYLPQLYKFYEENKALDSSISGAKKITGDEFARLKERTMTKIENDLSAGNITQAEAAARTQAFEEFQKAGGQIENPAFLAARALQNVGGFVSKQKQFKELAPFAKTSKQVGEEFLNDSADVTLKKGLEGTAETEFERHLRAITALSRATGKRINDDKVAAQAAEKLINDSVDVVRVGGEELRRLPESPAFGELSGKYVPEGLHTFLTDKTGERLNSTPGKVLTSLLTLQIPGTSLGFKSFKTVYSPGSQVRNFLSNQILNYLADPASFRKFGEAYKVLRQGQKNPAFREMQEVGLFSGGFIGEEVNKFYNKLDSIKDIDEPGKIVKVWETVKTGHNKLADLREFSENWGKAQQYLFARSKGATPEEAKRAAEAALFAYQKVGPGVRYLRSTGIPFLTFTTKAVPFIAKQGAKNPARLAAFVKGESAISDAVGVDASESAYLPDWMKGMLPTPFKDSAGNRIYINPKYVYPWGNIFSTEDFQPLPGLPFIGKGGSLPGGVSVSPVVSEFASQVSGRDLFTGQEFVRESQTPGQQVRARVEKAVKTIAPAPVAAAIPFLPGATSTTKSQQTRGPLNSQIGANLGLQLQPFDAAGARESTKEAEEAIRRETTSEVNRAIKAGKSASEINKIRVTGAKRLRELRGL